LEIQENSKLGQIFSAFVDSITEFYDPVKLALIKQVAASSPSPADVEVAYSLLSSWSTTGLILPTPIPPAPPFSFPADHSLHFDIPIEWYFVTLSLTLEDGVRLSLIFSFFRKAIASPGTAPPGTTDMDRQIFSTSFAVTIESSGPPFIVDHYAYPTTTYAPVEGGVEYTSDPFHLAVGGNSITGTANVLPFSMFLEGPGDAVSGRPSIEIDVECDATYPLFLQGENGWLGDPGGPSWYYYSWANQRTNGAVVINGLPLRIISGIAWVDHQWGGYATPSSPVAPPWSGWSWFESQFPDGRAITISCPHGAIVDGKLPAVVPGIGLYVEGGSSTTLFGVELSVSEYTKSPDTDAYIPSAWQFTSTSPSPIELTVTATTDFKQQSMWNSVLIEYGEAAVTVHATGIFNGNPIDMYGVGYSESVGFEDPAEVKTRNMTWLRSSLQKISSNHGQHQ
jgi:predicted secreted hydrolase